jgi:hypothetical protein
MHEKTFNGLTLSELDEFANGLHDRLALDQEDGACLADSYVLSRAVLELIPEVKLIQHERDICREQVKLLRKAAQGGGQ